jgi:SPP1 gp7 family putative phage head morphogenesis protein
VSEIVIVSSKAQLREALRSMQRRRALPRRPKRVPLRYPRPIEQAYAVSLRQELDRAAMLVERFLPDLARVVPRRQDASAALTRSIDTLQIVWAGSAQTTQKARLASAQTSTNSKDQTQRQMRSVLGIQPEMTEPWLREESDAFVRANVRLVTKVTDEFFDRLEQRINNGIRNGLRVEQIRAEIQRDFLDDGEELAKAKRRAELIARDQIGSFFGDLSKRRQTELGLVRYRWSTSNDERVRPSHAEREGEIFTWDDPIEEQLREKGLEVDPIDGSPGIPIGCRCTPQAVIEDLLT